MKKKSLNKTSLTIIVVLFAIITIINASFTFAYFTANKSISTPEGGLNFGKLELDVTGAGIGKSTTTCELHNLMPGCTIEFVGGISLGDSSKSTIDAFVRMKPSVVVDEESLSESAVGRKAELEAMLLEEITDKLETAGSDGKVWLKPTGDDEGEYYYFAGKFISSIDPATGNTRVADISNTEVLSYNLSKLTTTLLLSKYDNDWQGANVSITLAIEAIQADHLGIAGVAVGNGANDNFASNQLLIDAIAGVENSLSANGWNVFTANSGDEEDEQVQSIEEQCLPYIEFKEYVLDTDNDPENTVLVYDEYVTTPDEYSAWDEIDMATDTEDRNLDRYMYAMAYKLKAIDNDAPANLAFPEYIKVVDGEFELATVAEWQAYKAYKVVYIATGFNSNSEYIDALNMYCTIKVHELTIPSTIMYFDFWNSTFQGFYSLEVINYNAENAYYEYYDTVRPFDIFEYDYDDNFAESEFYRAEVDRAIVLNIGENVRSIVKGLFSESDITEVNFLGDNPQIETIGASAFRYSHIANDFVIPSSVIEIGEQAFDLSSGDDDSPFVNVNFEVTTGWALYDYQNDKHADLDSANLENQATAGQYLMTGGDPGYKYYTWRRSA